MSSVPLLVVQNDYIESPSDETAKTEVTCQIRCGTIKIPPCLKANLTRSFTGNGERGTLQWYVQPGTYVLIKVVSIKVSGKRENSVLFFPF